jgi:hypothetical protein
MQRHPNDNVTVLPDPHADPSSDYFVPIRLRAAFDALDAAAIERMKRELYGVIPEPWRRNVSGRPRMLNHRSNPDDFAVALHLTKLDEAARRAGRADDLAASIEQSRRTHTCALCGLVDATAVTASYVGDNRWCRSCRDVQRQQELAEHAALVVDGKTVEQLVAAARKTQATP